MPSHAIGPIFFLCALFLAAWHLDNSRGDNAVSRAAMVAAIVEDGTLCIDRFAELTNDKALVDGHYYSEKPPLPALLVVPFHAVGQWIGLLPRSEPGSLPAGLIALGGFLCGSLPFALLLFIAFRRMERAGLSRYPAAMALVAFFGSFLFVYSGSFFGHMLAALFIVLAWERLEKDRHFLAGLFAGAAVLCEYSLVVFPLVWLVQLLAQKRISEAGHVVLGGIPGVAILLLMNYNITGDPLSLPYSHVAEYGEERGFLGIILPSFTVVFQLLWGAYRGMLWYAPITALVLVTVLAHRWRRPPVYWLMHPLVIPCILLVALISAHTMWWGGWAFGPRHITVVAVLVLISGLPHLPDRPWNRWTFALLGSFGLFLALGAKLTTWGAFPSGVYDPINSILIPALRSHAWTEMQWPAFLGLSPGVATLVFLLIFASTLLVFLRIDHLRNKHT